MAVYPKILYVSLGGYHLGLRWLSMDRLYSKTKRALTPIPNIEAKVSFLLYETFKSPFCLRRHRSGR